MSSTLIEARSPTTWRDLEQSVGRILTECDYEVEFEKALPRARGRANVDVYAVEHTSPPDRIVVECKHWRTLVRQSVVEGFRGVVTDSGANEAFVVSAVGFESGAVDTAAYTNIRLVDWEGFQEQFVQRWFERYMLPRLEQEMAALIEYTEPLNARIAHKAVGLSSEQRERLEALRRKHLVLSMAFMPSAWLPPPRGKLTWPNIPLRALLTSGDVADELAVDVVDTHALRPLLEVLTRGYRDAIAEFEEVFGAGA